MAIHGGWAADQSILGHPGFRPSPGRPPARTRYFGSAGSVGLSRSKAWSDARSAVSAFRSAVMLDLCSAAARRRQLSSRSREVLFGVREQRLMLGRHAPKRLEACLHRVQLRRDLAFDELGERFGVHRAELELLHRGADTRRRCSPRLRCTREISGRTSVTPRNGTAEATATASVTAIVTATRGTGGVLRADAVGQHDAADEAGGEPGDFRASSQGAGREVVEKKDRRDRRQPPRGRQRNGHARVQRRAQCSIRLVSPGALRRPGCPRGTAR